MTNTSLLRCATAFLVLSCYIWLFGITGVIEGEQRTAYADEGLEFVPPVGSISGSDNNSEGEERIFSALNANINPLNNPKPGFVDLPGGNTPAGRNNPASDDSQSDSQSDTEPLPPPEVPDIPTPTTASPPTNTTTTPAPTAAPEPTTTTTPTQTTTAPPPPTTTTTPRDNETVIDPSLLPRLTVQTPNGQVTDTALNIISRIVQNEVGSAFDVEAIKAQAVASYTYVMHYQSQGRAANAELSSIASERVTESVREVLGQALYFNGDYIAAVYCASSAGFTASSANVWGGDIPYLRSVRTEFDIEHDPNYGLTATFSSNDVRVAVLERTGIQLTGAPGQWLEIVGRVDTVYVGAMTVGGRSSYTASDGREVQFTGRHFRDIMGGGRIFRSAAFEFSYNPSTDFFTFITYGYGHGVGLSQNGANILARQFGYDYKQILAFYYPGAALR
ncbi:MAG: SpoIID/LytB domain-containing protein [Oscillospiraceae bacterium]|jgi:stage II sporulation protein D|nr:SpoIID/LytB domain-containing protein [Oscillospiraceae bacterium]